MDCSKLLIVFLPAVFICIVAASQEDRVHDSALVTKLVVVTVATEETDGYQRFLTTARLYNLNVKTYGMGQTWFGGDMATSIGGGQKVNILLQGLDQYKNDTQTLLLFSDSYDAVIVARAEEFVKAFLSFDARIVFSAESFCWPDLSLISQYPSSNGYRFLNSGGYMGYAADVYRMMTLYPVKDNDDDQLFFTKIFLAHRDELGIVLDNYAKIFQNLNGALDDTALTEDVDGFFFLRNLVHNTVPMVIHANGPIKPRFNQMTNYIAKAWNSVTGCHSCKEGTFRQMIPELVGEPFILMAVFIEYPTPFVPEFFRSLAGIDYPKDRIDLVIHTLESIHEGLVKTFIANMSSSYRSAVHYGSKSLTEHDARVQAMKRCLKLRCDYYFSVDSPASIQNPKVLRSLIEINRSVVAPVMTKPKLYWSTFWGAVGSDGFYSRSDDYHDIVTGKKRGLWNVPYIYLVYLVKGKVLAKVQFEQLHDELVDFDLLFAAHMRKLGVFMYAANMESYGHIKNHKNYRTNKLHNDLWDMIENPSDWEQKYLHPEFRSFLEGKLRPDQPCPDVFWFPFVTTEFANELVEELENFGDWSAGKNQDSRIVGGYENVPTVDIHFKQLEREAEWLHLLRKYLTVASELIFQGYHSKGEAYMNFVVKYHPKGQYYLRPHHDASTFTINVALNRAGIDFLGGGCRFLRYNCSITATRQGWALMHPGRLTHLHEGLPILDGVRYILVSFVDP